MTCKKDTKNSDRILRRLQNADFHGVSLDIKVMHRRFSEWLH